MVEVKKTPESASTKCSVKPSWSPCRSNCQIKFKESITNLLPQPPLIDVALREFEGDVDVLVLDRLVGDLRHEVLRLAVKVLEVVAVRHVRQQQRLLGCSFSGVVKIQDSEFNKRYSNNNQLSCVKHTKQFYVLCIQFLFLEGYVLGSAKEWSLGCVKRAPVARGGPDTGIAQPRDIF